MNEETEIDVRMPGIEPAEWVNPPTPEDMQETALGMEQTMQDAFKEQEREDYARAVKLQRGYEALSVGWADVHEGAEAKAARRKEAVDAFGEEYVALYEAAPATEQRRAVAERYLCDHFTEIDDESFRPAKRYCDSFGLDYNANVHEDIYQRFIYSHAARVKTEQLIDNLREEELKWVGRYLAGNEEMTAERSGQIVELFGPEMVERIARVRDASQLIEDFVRHSKGEGQTSGVLLWEDAVYAAVVDPETGEVDNTSRVLMELALRGIAEDVQERERETWAFQAGKNSLDMAINRLLWNASNEDSAEFEAAQGRLAEYERLATDEGYAAARMSQEAYEKLKAKGGRDAAIQRMYAKVYDPEELRQIREELLPAARADMKRRVGRKVVRGMLQDYVTQADASPEGTAWYKQALKGMGEMAGSTAPYMIPFVGIYAGTAMSLMSGSDSRLNANIAAGMGVEAAMNSARQDSLIAAAVELMPWSRIGGRGFNATLGRSLQRAGYKPGAFSTKLAEFSSRSAAHAALTETVGGVIDEGVLEPLGQGLLTMGTDAAMDALGVEHGKSRSFGEAFAELREVWTDPTQLAALVFFTGALTGARLPQMSAQSRAFAAQLRELSQQAGVWQAAGLTDAEVRQVMHSDNPLETGRQIFNSALERDPEGVKRRIARQGVRLKEDGFSLRLTGTTGQGDANTEAALAEAYREMVEEGVMPQVERIADKDGQPMFRLVERDRHTQEVKQEQELTAQQADTYLQLRMAQVDARRVRSNQQTIYEDMAQHVEQLAGTALAQQAEQKGAAEGINMANMNELGEGVGEMVQASGVMNYEAMKRASAKLGGAWKRSLSGFRERARIAGRRADMAGTAAFRGGWVTAPMQLDGKTVFGSIINYAQGNVTPLEMLEESVETRVDMRLQLRAQEIAEAEGVDTAQAKRRALDELADVVRRARGELLALEPSLQISEVPESATYQQVIEAMSDMGRARLIASSLMPSWMSEVQDIVSSALDESAEAVRIAEAAKRAGTEGKPGWQQLEEIFTSFDLPMGNVYSQARIDAAVIQQVRLSRARVRDVAVAPTAAEVQERQAEDMERDAAIEQEEENYAAACPEPQKVEGKTSAEQTADNLAQVQEAKAPAGMKGVFVRDACVYNEAGGFYVGCVPIRNLRDSKEVQQVKAGGKGKHGVVNPITGEYQQETEAIYVWRRKDGTLEVISGRHKYALALEDGTESAICYVFNEDAQHNAKWARLLDFENNMRGDQADELTAAIYTRETGYDDATLRKKGLMRNKSRSKRGILIGREARAELWDRFVNGAVSPMEAEWICEMTRGIRDKARIDEIQRRCCMMLEQKKHPEYISAMVQLMAHKESVFMKQGLLDLGADFEADMERAANYVEKNVRKLTDAINIIRGGQKLSGEKRQLAESLGQYATSDDASGALMAALVDMRERFRNIGAYPDLVAAASMWDGVTELDPVSMARNYSDNELAQAAEEAGMSREEWEEAQAVKAAKRAAEAGTGSLFGGSYSLRTMIVDASKHKLQAKEHVALLPCPEVLLELGYPDGELVTEARILSKLVNEHKLTPDEIMARIDGLNSPLFVFEDFTPDKYGNTQILVFPGGLATNRKNEMGDVKAPVVISKFEKSRHYVSSLYPMDELSSIKGLLKKGKLKYSAFSYDELKLLANSIQADASTAYASELSLTSELLRAVVDIGFSSDTITGEEIVKRKQERTESNFSGSLRDMTQQARVMLRRRDDDLEGEELLHRWDELLARFETASTGRHDGAARLGVLVSLLESTRSVLPPQYAKLGRLHALMKWAAVYAHLVSTGEVRRDDVLKRERFGEPKGAIYEKFVAAMQREYQGSLQKGLSEAEAREVLQELGERRLEDALLKVAKECRSRLDVFVKARARERIELMAERAYPKKEKGKKSTRGKMDTPHYRAMNTMLAWMDKTPDEVAARTEYLRAQLEKMEGEESAEPNAPTKEELEEELRIVQLYGDWKGMSAGQARVAAEDFVQFVLMGRHAWDARVEEERRRREWRRLRMKFTKPYNANTRSKAKRDGSNMKVNWQAFKSFMINTMSYAQLMQAGRKVFGEAFARARLQEIADANAALRNARRERDDMFARCLMEATGLTSERELVDWLNRFAKVEKKTGIFKREMKNHTLEMTRDEAEEWCEMTHQQRAARRRELNAEAERTGMAPQNVPTEADITKLAEKLATMNERGSKAQKVRVKVPRYGEKIELQASRDAVANAILLLEQEDYQHLIEYEGLTPRDKDGKEINRDIDPDTPLDVEQTLKPLYDFIGKDGRAFAYAMRRYVAETGKRMQAVYEAQQGVPLQMKPLYWRGNFNINTIKEKDTLTEGNGAVGAGGYGFLLDRVRHYNRLEWTNTATMVFGMTVEAQNNYTYTSGITREWRALLSDTDFQKRMEVELGRPYMTALSEWLDIIDGVRRKGDPSLAKLRNVMQRMSKGLALAALAGNGFVLVKQSSAVLHGLMGGEVPLAVIERGDGVKELTWRKIGAAEYSAAMARTKAGLGKVSLKELAACDWFKARTDSKQKNIARRMVLAEDKKQHVWSNKLTDKSMDAINATDFGANLLGMHALADAVYRDMEEINNKQGLGLTDEQIKQEALAAVGRALALSAQPNETSEKSLYAARGGIISNMLFQFKSETINKLGLTFSRMFSGEWMPGLRDYLIFGATNTAIAAAIAWLRYGDDDEPKKGREWQKPLRYALNTLTGDLAAVPIIGDEIKRGVANLTGEYHVQRSMLASYIDIPGICRHLERIYSGEKSRRRMDWHEYVAEVNGLTRKLGVLSAFLGDGATWAEMVLSAAAAGNIIRTTADTVNAANRKD